MLLAHPGDDAKRKELLVRLGGRIVKKIKKKMPSGRIEEIEAPETEGGILSFRRSRSRSSSRMR